MKTYKDPDLVYNIKVSLFRFQWCATTKKKKELFLDCSICFAFQFFDMRVLFLLTALVSDTRPRMIHQLHGFTYLIELLDLLLRTAEDEQRTLNSQDVNLASEVLKILFNLTVAIEKSNLDEVSFWINPSLVGCAWHALFVSLYSSKNLCAFRS